MKKLLPRVQFKSQAGNIGIIAAIVIVAGLFLWQIWKPSTLTPQSSLDIASGSCGPDLSDPTTVKIAVFGNPAGSGRPGSEKIYRKIKSNIKVDRFFTDQMRSDGSVDSTQHLFQSDLAKNVGLPSGSYVFYLNNKSSPLDFVEKYLGGQSESMVYVTQKQEVGSPPGKFWKFDVYIDVDKIPMIPSSEIAKYTCSDQGGEEIKQTIAYPTQGVSPDKKQIQLQYFTVNSTSNLLPTWLNPHCKPIIYLYPEQKQDVHVKLNPKGFLTETIPDYPKEGWYVTAYPDGKIDYKDKTYDYLYYESKILDSETKVPKEGFIRKATEMKKLFDEILPKLGLNHKEAKEFTDYWIKALPKAPYYFVGVMDKESIDHIEPLTISPKPDTIIRVRAYFKALDKPIDVTEPVLGKNVERSGFSVVEWGGMVKRDANHPFTCSE